MQKENKMKKLMIISFALALLMSAVAVARYGAQPPDNSKSGTTVKTVSITGKISADGTMFVSDRDSKSWTISNPDAVKGHEGHHVTLQAQVDADKNEVHVVGLRPAAESPILPAPSGRQAGVKPRGASRKGPNRSPGDALCIERPATHIIAEPAEPPDADPHVRVAVEERTREWSAPQK